MGLSLSHGIQHISYSRFHLYRIALAQAIKIDLHEMLGFGGERSWHSLEDEPLLPLLNHSDSDGEIEHQYLAALADRLEELLPMLTQTYQEISRLLITGLREAESAQEDLVFS